MAGRLTTKPDVFEIATPELIPLGVSFANRLGVSETVASVVSITVTHISSGTLVPAALSGAASLATPIVTQVIDPSALVSGSRYAYVVTVLIGTRKESTHTVLSVVF